MRGKLIAAMGRRRLWFLQPGKQGISSGKGFKVGAGTRLHLRPKIGERGKASAKKKAEIVERGPIKTSDL